MPRSKGGVNYTLAEQRLLLHVVREELPHRREQWQQVSIRYNEARDKTTVARDADSLWRKFKGLCRAADDRSAPPNVKMAKEIKSLIDGHTDFPGEEESIAESEVNGQDLTDEVALDGRQEANHENGIFAHSNNMVPTSTSVSSINSSADDVASADHIHEMLVTAPPLRAKRQRVQRSGENQSSVTVNGLSQLWAMMREENAARDRREERRLQEWQEECRLDREEAAARHREMMSLIVQLFNRRESDTSNSN